MPGFFDAVDVTGDRSSFATETNCQACRLYKNCLSPRMPLFGRGRKKILIVGEAPGKQEDEHGRPFVGASGRFLAERLAKVGIDMDRDCWITNAIVCRPPGNASPTDAEVDHCRPQVLRAIREKKPERILLVGQTAVRSVIGHLWPGATMSMTLWAGWRIPCRRWNAWICPTYHPAFVLREPDGGARAWLDRHLAACAAVSGVPWPDGVSDVRDRVACVLGPSGAVGEIEAMQASGRPIAFDFETTTLKPDSPAAEIICCGLSDGRRAVAFPVAGEAVRPLRELLDDPAVPKIGANAKFEERWCRARGFRVRGWEWDVVEAGHILDNRRGAAGVKFQALARLGYEPWNEDVEAALTSPGGNTANRIRAIPIRDVLLYCGIDALVEWELAEWQMAATAEVQWTGERQRSN